ncbi:MAG TPA: hypothetical protein PKA82_17795 [Pyrinomonadaceae bacterium]|nr:hypothetical protein [Pyrinomonadaceae bacterium]
MRIKKFRCINCGGPKVNKYVTPYIMCDFCGGFTDIDFAIGIETWNENAMATFGYQAKKIALMAAMQNSVARGDRAENARLQREFWDMYYKTFPAYLPPTIDDDAKYQLYLEVCVTSSVDSSFDPKWQNYGVEQQRLQSLVTFGNLNGKNVAESSSFFRLADFFVSITKEGMRSFYEDERYAIMHELLPMPVHLKMKTSMFVQAWLPYLSDEDADRLLKMLGFSNDYEEIEQPNGSTIECHHCKVQLFAPDGSLKVFCEHCRRTTPVRSRFFCSSCGSPNEMPDDPSKAANCSSCGIANRLIQPFFG